MVRFTRQARRPGFSESSGGETNGVPDFGSDAIRGQWITFGAARSGIRPWGGPAGSWHQQYRHARMLGGALRHGAKQRGGVGAQTARPHHDQVAVLRLRNLGDGLALDCRQGGVRAGSGPPQRAARAPAPGPARCAPDGSRRASRRPRTSRRRRTQGRCTLIRCTSRAGCCAQVLAQGEQVANGLRRSFGPVHGEQNALQTGRRVRGDNGRRLAGGAFRARSQPLAQEHHADRAGGRRDVMQECRLRIDPTLRRHVGYRHLAGDPAQQSGPQRDDDGEASHQREQQAAGKDHQWNGDGPGPRSTRPCCLWRQRRRQSRCPGSSPDRRSGSS